jgi:hypothetical protein
MVFDPMFRDQTAQHAFQFRQAAPVVLVRK